MNNYPKSYIGKNPEVISPFLKELFQKFGENQIVWAVLHGGESLPSYTRRDIDFLFTHKQIKEVKKIVLEVAKKHGWVCYARFKFSALHSLWLMLPPKAGTESAYLQLDCFVDISLRGICFFKETSDVLARRYKNSNGVWCLDDFDAAAIVVIKEVLANTRIEREQRQKEITEVVERDHDCFKVALSRFRISPGTVDAIIKKITACDWNGFEELSKRMKREIYRPGLRDLPLMSTYLCDLIRMFYSPFLRFFIVVIGPDGCGKTSVADAIHERFRYRPFYGFKRIHGNFGSLPRLRDIWMGVAGVFGKKIVYAADPAPATRHMGMSKPLSKLRSMFYIAYYGIEYGLGRLQLRKWRTFSGMVIADRYFCDYYYMRGHMNCPVWWKRLWERLAPKPDLIFSLERPAADIYAQKPELTVEEIEREQQVIRQYLHGKRSARIIDASHGLDTTVESVAAEIEKWLLEKVR